MTEKRIHLGRGFGTRLRDLLESGGLFTLFTFRNLPPWNGKKELTPGELVEVETESLERFILQVEESRIYMVEEIPEEVAREAGFLNGFSFQFVMRNLLIPAVLVIRFRVVKYVEYDF